MRRAFAQTFRRYLDAYAEKVVAPVLEALGADTMSELEGPASALAARRHKGRSVAASLEADGAFWRANVSIVRREYASWLQWAALAPLDARTPANTLGRAHEVQFLFREVFYSIGLNDPQIWTLLVGDPLTRRGLCERFVTDVGHSVCCYCDIDTVRGQYYFDHFVPGSFTAYLSVAATNLYVVCSSCNSTQVGKGAQTVLPVVAPADCELGRHVSFKIGINQVEVFSDGTREVSNALQLLKL